MISKYRICAIHSLIAILSIMLVACSSGGDGDSSSAGNTPGGGGTTTPAPQPGTFPATSNIFINDTYDISEVSVDSNGDSILRTKLVILFKPTATVDEVDGLMSRINATITSSIKGARSVNVRILDPTTLSNLETIITDIENESFVDTVMKSIVDGPAALPDNVSYENPDDLKIIDNQLAVGGHAAWNAKDAIVSTPNVIIDDWFGDGWSQITNFLDIQTRLDSIMWDNSPKPDDHGYHVAGILNGQYGDGSSTASLVTGMMPGPVNLGIIDRTQTDSYDASVHALLTAGKVPGTSIYSTSIVWQKCANLPSGTCKDPAWSMLRAIAWADLVRSANVESRMFHATCAGNRNYPNYHARDTETSFTYAAAATMTNMATEDGVQVPTLTNTLAVENLVGTGNPRKIQCLYENSFVGGQISALGTDVTSLSLTGTTIKSGCSMATPQVAGLAAYLAAIDPTLSAQKIREILLATSQTVPTSGGFNCSDWGSPSPAIDAYAAVLSLDKSSALNGTRSDAPVRNAILDIVDQDPTVLGSNGQFDENDLKYFIEQIEKGSDEIRQGMPKVKYSRADLNGDAYDGSGNSAEADNYKKKFNLDIDYPPMYTTVTQMIEETNVEFDENALTDTEILCYYAYSDLYTGDIEQRKALMESRCLPGIMAVYYWHTNDISFGSGTACGNDPDTYNVDEYRENFSTLDSVDKIINRPKSHYWYAGDSDSYMESFSRGISKGFLTTNGCIYHPYSGRSVLDSLLEHSEQGSKLEININAIAESECHDVITDDPQWECSGALAQTLWQAQYDYEIKAATTLKIVLNLMCSGPNLSSPGYPDPNNPSLLPPTDVFVSVARFDENGDGVIQYRDDFSKLFVPINLYCNDDNPVIDVEQLVEFDAPLNEGDTDTAVIIITGQGGAFGNMGNADQLPSPVPLPPPPQPGTTGLQTNTTTMTGFVEVVPAD